MMMSGHCQRALAFQSLHMLVRGPHRDPQLRGDLTVAGRLTCPLHPSLDVCQHLGLLAGQLLHGRSPPQHSELQRIYQQIVDIFSCAWTRIRRSEYAAIE
jgi:hypothetical protein